MSNKIVFIIGGARCGKSSFAINEASKIKGPRAYIATAEALDNEMKERIEKHKKNRGVEWNTQEEPLEIAPVLSDIKERYRVIVLDCLTLWLSNILGRAQNTEHRTQTTKDSIHEFIDTLKQFKDSSVCPLGSIRLSSSQAEFCVLYIVSNEVGMGIVPDNKTSRKFRDFAGFLNQKVAAISDEVYMVTSGIPIKIKNAK